MRINNIQISFTMSMPYDAPDKNGVLYSYEAIHNALSSMTSGLPILVCTNNGDSKVIGNTTCSPYAIHNNKEEGIIRFTVDGVVYFGGTECFVNEIDSSKKTITDFKISSLGFSE